MLLLICFQFEPSSIFHVKIVRDEQFMIRIMIMKTLDALRNDLAMIRNRLNLMLDNGYVIGDLLPKRKNNRKCFLYVTVRNVRQRTLGNCQTLLTILNNEMLLHSIPFKCIKKCNFDKFQTSRSDLPETND